MNFSFVERDGKHLIQVYYSIKYPGDILLPCTIWVLTKYGSGLACDGVCNEAPSSSHCRTALPTALCSFNEGVPLFLASDDALFIPSFPQTVLEASTITPGNDPLPGKSATQMPRAMGYRRWRREEGGAGAAVEILVSMRHGWVREIKEGYLSA